MKINLQELRLLVRSIIQESICPACNGDGAYIGLNKVECSNKACRLYVPTEKESAPTGAVSLDAVRAHFPGAIEAYAKQTGWSLMDGDSYVDEEGKLTASGGDDQVFSWNDKENVWLDQ